MYLKKVELISYEWPYLECRLLTGKGYYVRSFAQDLGQVLGTGGYVENLLRTKVGQFLLDKALTTTQLAMKLENGEKLSELGYTIKQVWGERSKMTLSTDLCSELLQGKFIEGSLVAKQGVLLFAEETGVVVGLVEEAKIANMIKLQLSL